VFGRGLVVRLLRWIDERPGALGARVSRSPLVATRSLSPTLIERGVDTAMRRHGTSVSRVEADAAMRHLCVISRDSDRARAICWGAT